MINELEKVMEEEEEINDRMPEPVIPIVPKQISEP
jgi:hypothetical protein